MPPQSKIKGIMMPVHQAMYGPVGKLEDKMQGRRRP